MSKKSTDILPGYPRSFELERDIKEGKQFVLNKKIIFPIERTMTEANNENGWMLNLAQVNILIGDTVVIEEIGEQGAYIVFKHISGTGHFLPHSYKVSFVDFIDKFYEVPVQIVKERKVKEFSNKTKEEVEDIIEGKSLEFGQGKRYKVKKEGYLLPVKWGNNRYKKESLLLNKGDIILIKEISQGKKAKAPRVFLEVINGTNKIEEKQNVLCSLSDLENYIKGALKEIEETSIETETL